MVALRGVEQGQFNRLLPVTPRTIDQPIGARLRCEHGFCGRGRDTNLLELPCISLGTMLTAYQGRCFATDCFATSLVTQQHRYRVGEPLVLFCQQQMFDTPDAKPVSTPGADDRAAHRHHLKNFQPRSAARVERYDADSRTREVRTDISATVPVTLTPG